MSFAVSLRLTRQRNLWQPSRGYASWKDWMPKNLIKPTPAATTTPIANTVVPEMPSVRLGNKEKGKAEARRAQTGNVFDTADPQPEDPEVGGRATRKQPRPKTARVADVTKTQPSASWLRKKMVKEHWRAQGKPPIAQALLPRNKEGKHLVSSEKIAISHRKLNLLARQIAGQPVDYALLQLQFSEKRVSNRLMHLLHSAKDHAIRYKQLDPARLIVAESWVNKAGMRSRKVEPRGRGHTGIVTKVNSRIKILLKEGLTVQEKKSIERKKKLKRIVSAGLVREDVPLRNPGAMWTW